MNRTKLFLDLSVCMWRVPIRYWPLVCIGIACYYELSMKYLLHTTKKCQKCRLCRVKYGRCTEPNCSRTFRYACDGFLSVTGLLGSWGSCVIIRYPWKINTLQHKYTRNAGCIEWNMADEQNQVVPGPFGMHVTGSYPWPISYSLWGRVLLWVIHKILTPYTENLSGLQAVSSEIQSMNRTKLFPDVSVCMWRVPIRDRSLILSGVGCYYELSIKY